MQQIFLFCNILVCQILATVNAYLSTASFLPTYSYETEQFPSPSEWSDMCPYPLGQTSSQLSTSDFTVPTLLTFEYKYISRIVGTGNAYEVMIEFQVDNSVDPLYITQIGLYDIKVPDYYTMDWQIIYGLGKPDLGIPRIDLVGDSPYHFFVKWVMQVQDNGVQICTTGFNIQIAWEIPVDGNINYYWIPYYHGCSTGDYSLQCWKSDSEESGTPISPEDPTIGTVDRSTTGLPEAINCPRRWKSQTSICDFPIGAQSSSLNYPKIEIFKFISIKWIQDDLYEVLFEFQISNLYPESALEAIHFYCDNSADGYMGFNLYYYQYPSDLLGYSPYHFYFIYVMKVQSIDEFICTTEFGMQYSWEGGRNAAYYHGCNSPVFTDKPADLPLQCWQGECPTTEEGSSEFETEITETDESTAESTESTIESQESTNEPEVSTIQTAETITEEDAIRTEPEITITELEQSTTDTNESTSHLDDPTPETQEVTSEINTTTKETEEPTKAQDAPSTKYEETTSESEETSEVSEETKQLSTQLQSDVVETGPTIEPIQESKESPDTSSEIEDTLEESINLTDATVATSGSTKQAVSTESGQGSESEQSVDTKDETIQEPETTQWETERITESYNHTSNHTEEISSTTEDETMQSFSTASEAEEGTTEVDHETTMNSETQVAEQSQQSSFLEEVTNDASQSEESIEPSKVTSELRDYTEATAEQTSTTTIQDHSETTSSTFAQDPKSEISNFTPASSRDPNEPVSTTEINIESKSTTESDAEVISSSRIPIKTSTENMTTEYFEQAKKTDYSVITQSSATAFATPEKNTSFVSTQTSRISGSERSYDQHNQSFINSLQTSLSVEDTQNLYSTQALTRVQLPVHEDSKILITSSTQTLPYSRTKPDPLVHNTIVIGQEGPTTIKGYIVTTTVTDPGTTYSTTMSNANNYQNLATTITIDTTDVTNIIDPTGFSKLSTTRSQLTNTSDVSHLTINSNIPVHNSGDLPVGQNQQDYIEDLTLFGYTGTIPTIIVSDGRVHSSSTLVVYTTAVSVSEDLDVAKTSANGDTGISSNSNVEGFAKVLEATGSGLRRCDVIVLIYFISIIIFL